jgi:RimJ/RimL family protein N-acetyltransferase
MKIKLKKYKKSDLKGHLQLLLMNKIYNKITPKTNKQEKEWLEKVIKSYSIKNPEFYVLKIILNKKAIGNIILEKINYKSKSGNIGYWVGKKYQGKGYVTNAIQLFLKNIKKRFKIKIVRAETKIKNIASQKVLEKNDFSLKKRKDNKLIFWEKKLK